MFAPRKIFRSYGEKPVNVSVHSGLTCMTNSSSDRDPSPGPLSVLKFGQPRTARLFRQISATTPPTNRPQFVAKAGLLNIATITAAWSNYSGRLANLNSLGVSSLWRRAATRTSPKP